MITAKIVWNDFIIFATRNKFTVRLSLEFLTGIRGRCWEKGPRSGDRARPSI